MRVIRKIGFLVLLLVAILLVQNASATSLADIHSTHYEGRSYYSYAPEEGDKMSGHIDFAVYDTGAQNGQDFETEFGTAPGMGRYVYAYQIFYDGISAGPLEYFAIVGIGENALAEPVNDNIGSMNDSLEDPSEEGVQPDKSYITSSTEHGMMGAWEFTNALLTVNEHSWFLVLRSDHDWKAGKYTFDSTLADELPAPNPEPCTVALLGLGSIVLFVRRRRSV